MTNSLFKNAWGYQGDAMNLPVANVDDALHFYERVLGFRIESRSTEPHNSAVLERDGIRMQIAENGSDPTQDGCAFEVNDIALLHEEYKEKVASFSASGSLKDQGASVSPEVKAEHRKDGSSWKVFFATAPDGLCYWFGEKQ